jgi:selenocysteine lyase/cysteine desulfurase
VGSSPLALSLPAGPSSARSAPAGQAAGQPRISPQSAAGGRPLADVVGADAIVPLVTGHLARYANLDYAASAPALRAVADLVAEVLPVYSSVHRGAGYNSQACTAAYEAARRDVGAFVGASDDDVVIFTRNTTDALNLLARAAAGPVIHLDLEHHANFLPWSGRGGHVIPVQPTLTGTLAAIADALASSPAALLTVTGASNVTGECPPLGLLADLAHAHGARIAVDGAQLVPHRRLDMGALDLDYLAFSGHKVYAPFGTGVLIGRRDWLDVAEPYLAGGGAVRSVAADSVRWADAPARHEAGTPNVVGAIALAAACRCLASLPQGAVREHESALLGRLAEGLTAVGARTLRAWGDADRLDRVAVASFTVPGYPAALVASYLSAEHGIGVRDGKFCAHPLLARLAAEGDGTAVRASLGLGSRAHDVDRLIGALDLLRRQGPSWTYGPDHRPQPDPRPLPGWAAPSMASPDRGDGRSPCGN